MYYYTYDDGILTIVSPSEVAIKFYEDEAENMADLLLDLDSYDRTQKLLQKWHDNE